MKHFQLLHDPILTSIDEKYIHAVLGGVTTDNGIARQFGTTRQVVKNRFLAIREKLEVETGVRTSSKLGILSSLAKRGTLRIE